MTRTESRSRPEERGGGRTNGRYFNCSFAYQCSTATTARGHLSLSLSHQAAFVLDESDTHGE